MLGGAIIPLWRVIWKYLLKLHAYDFLVNFYSYNSTSKIIHTHKQNKIHFLKDWRKIPHTYLLLNA